MRAMFAKKPYVNTWLVSEGEKKYVKSILQKVSEKLPQG